MRLNLGCGAYPADGWVNVDLRDDGPRPDVVADLADLPFDDDAAEAVYAGHVFEHIGVDDIPVALKEIDRVLAPDGVLMVVGPDLDRALAHYPDAVPDIVPGEPNPDRPGEAHLWESREAAMVQLLAENGWNTTTLSIVAVPESWPVVSRIGWQFAIEATR